MINSDNVRDLFIYDNGKLYWKIKPAGRVRIGDEAGYEHHSGYRFCEYKSAHYAIHRLTFLYHYGYMPDLVDHRDRNRSNNLIDNLRSATSTENRVNSDAARGISKTRGVTIRGNKYEARIMLKGQSIQLGWFDNIEDASAAYLNARKEMYPSVNS